MRIHPRRNVAPSTYLVPPGKSLMLLQHIFYMVKVRILWHHLKMFGSFGVVALLMAPILNIVSNVLLKNSSFPSFPRVIAFHFYFNLMWKINIILAKETFSMMLPKPCFSERMVLFWRLSLKSVANISLKIIPLVHPK